MRVPRIIAHPVMGWYIIALLAIAVAALPISYFFSFTVGETFAQVSTLIVVFGFVLYIISTYWTRK